MRIKGWDKLRYQFVAVAGVRLTIDTTWSILDTTDNKATYYLTLCDADDVGDTMIKVILKEGIGDEFYMKAELVQQQITPNINRVFRRKDLINMNGFLKDMLMELNNNGMVNSYLSLMGDIQSQRMRNAPSMNTFSSHSFNSL
jgi:hypothetical protein